MYFPDREFARIRTLNVYATVKTPVPSVNEQSVLLLRE